MVTDSTPIRTPDHQTPFHDLDSYLALGRLGGLALSADGRRAVVSHSVLDAKSTGYVTSLWEVDVDGEAPARRLTRGAKGEGGPAFTASGDLLFVAKRAESEDDAVSAVWRLPAAGGEAHVLVRRPGGVSGVLTAAASDAVVIEADTFLGAADEAAERDLLRARKDHKVSAILHTGYPVRYWDHDLGPDAPRLFAVEGAPLAKESADESADGGAASITEPGPDVEHGTRDLTPDAAKSLVNSSVDLAPDGSFLISSWARPVRAQRRSHLVRIDVSTGERNVLVLDEDGDLSSPVISPDGRLVAYLRESISTPDRAPNVTVWTVSVDGGTPQQIAPDWDRGAGELAWLPGSSELLLVADEAGHAPVFRVGLSDAEPHRLTQDGAYSQVRVAPDGSFALALRSSYAYPLEAVRIDLAVAASGAGSNRAGTSAAGANVAADESRVALLRGPSARPELPGRLEDISTEVTDPDGTSVTVRSYLALPEGASAENPAPLLLWIHGGPINSWNAWSWRWNPWNMVAAGYAVLLPDPALSTGYGQHFLQRGWGNWGAAPYTDIMAATDAAEARADIDETRTAAMGGSFGGYMANWVAGHTNRFKAIVTHASLWALDQFGPTTDAAYYWARETTAEMAAKNSPHAFVGEIRTPMLVIHGDKDYRVPIGEGLRLWYELLTESGLPAAEDGSTEHQFLYFPNENHWILSPQHSKVWYEVVLAFLDQRVLGTTRDLPSVLGN